MAPVTEALGNLVALLDLEPIEVDVFRGQSPDEKRQRVYGGQVAGQALVAAGRTVPPDRLVHSLHAYFLRPGDPAVPLLYEVDRIRDGRSFTTRRVVAIQHGRPIFNLAASFHVTEDGGLDHQQPMPAAPDPESLPTLAQRLAGRYGERAEELGGWLSVERPIDTRYVDPTDVDPTDVDPTTSPVQQVWFRADGELPDDPLLHACVIAYASDLSLLDAALFPHGIEWDDPRLMGASLDHAMWFHRPARADQWLLYHQESPSAHGGRALCRGDVFARDGTIVVSVVQEGLVRLIAS